MQAKYKFFTFEKGETSQITLGFVTMHEEEVPGFIINHKLSTKLQQCVMATKKANAVLSSINCNISKLCNAA